LNDALVIKANYAFKLLVTNKNRKPACSYEAFANFKALATSKHLHIILLLYVTTNKNILKI
jgi:hypothetical protein